MIGVLDEIIYWILICHFLYIKILYIGGGGTHNYLVEKGTFTTAIEPR
jgi:hypothetical protein